MTISRITLPENYYDKSSDQLLCQPEPQYLFASLFLSAIAAQLGMPAGMGLDGRMTPVTGGAYASADRDRLVLAEKLPSSIFALGIDFSKGPGSTVRINRPQFADSTYTVASRAVATASTISTQPITIGSEQTHLTLVRYAGPYDNGNTRVAPIAIEAFDANMGIHSAPSIVAAQLTRDYHKFLDAVHVLQGEVGTAIYPEGMTADNDATTAGSFPFTLEQLSRTEQTMDDANLPVLPDGSRIMVLTPKQWKELKHDPEYEAQAAFHKEFALLFPNYVGSVGKFHVFKSTTLRTVNNGSTVPVHRGVAIAPGAFMGGMGRKPRVAPSTDDNYGETAKVIWIGDLAFGVADSRFLCSVRSA